MQKFAKSSPPDPHARKSFATYYANVADRKRSMAERRGRAELWRVVSYSSTEMNLCHSTNTPCRCVDRHTTRSLSIGYNPFNIKTYPATLDFNQKRILNLYKNSQHSFNPHPLYSRLNTQNLRSNPTRDIKPKPKYSHTQNFSNTPKPTMTPSSKSLTTPHSQPFTAKLIRFCRHAPDPASLFGLNAQMRRSIVGTSAA